MIHSDLVITLVVAFVAAFVGGFGASRLGLPPIVGYLIAGIAIGPYTPGGHADSGLAAELAEVGVILLMFGVGLHFSVREMLNVGPIALPGAIGQILAATILGMGASLMWGWSPTEGLIFGLCLSVASTVVLLRALEDRNLLDTHAGHVAVGWLIVEDLFTVLVLVLLPAVANSGDGGAGLVGMLNLQNGGLSVALTLVQAGAFVALMLIFGVRIIPRLMNEVVRAGSRELFTLCILALALGVSLASSELFGASLPLGAFLAGVVLNESELSHRAGLEALPLREAFAVLFFVSVGMIFDPDILLSEPLKVALVLTIVVVGKAIAALVLVCGIGYGVRTGVVVAAALAQVGEFSFILAGLGFSLGLLPAEATSLILAGSILSIALNPLLFRNVDLMESLLGRWPRFISFAQRRHPETDTQISLRRHVVIAGYGRSGSNLARILSGRGLPFVVIENDPFVFERARAAGYTTVFGDTTQQVVLEQAGIMDAQTLAVTFANQPGASITVQNGRRLNATLNVIARALGSEAGRQLRQSGAAEVVDADFEASLEFVRHVLHRYGMDAREIGALQMRWRAEQRT